MEIDEEHKHCASCGQPTVFVTLETQVLQYEMPTGPVDITVKDVPVYSCTHCGFDCTDWVAEMKRDEAVIGYLRNRVIELEELLATRRDGWWSERRQELLEKRRQYLQDVMLKSLREQGGSDEI